MKNTGFQYRRPWLMKVNQGFFTHLSDGSVFRYMVDMWLKK
jgi:hypothetical protein